MPRAKLPPTIRQRRLGAELRRLREQADLNATQAGQLLGWSQSRVSGVESGAFAVSADKVRGMARAYMCTDEDLIEALTQYTGGRSRGWWEEYRELLPPGMLDLAELEHHARRIEVVSLFHIPGLLQTVDHARAIISDFALPLKPHEVEHHTSFRIKRQAVLYGGRPTEFTAIVHEAALRMGFGGPAIARAQLDRLLAMSEQDNITLTVTPFGTGSFPIAGQGIIYLGGEITRLDTVQLDTDDGSQFLDTQPRLTMYRKVLSRMAQCTLPTRKSRDFIRRLIKES